MDSAGIFLTDALKNAFGAGALDPGRDPRVFRFERFGDLLGKRKINRRVPDDLAFAPGGVDQLRRDGLRLGRSRFDRGRKRS
jgi:hypothetical protein